MGQNGMTYRLLSKVDSPKDIKSFSIDELKELCAEIRHYMIECCSVNPGHVGSSLGAVELIVGLHYVYDAPEDKLVFDVGHQAYAHKIIWGNIHGKRKLLLTHLFRVALPLRKTMHEPDLLHPKTF